MGCVCMSVFEYCYSYGVFCLVKECPKKNLWHMFFVTLAGQSFYLLLRSASESVGLKLS